MMESAPDSRRSPPAAMQRHANWIAAASRPSRAGLEPFHSRRPADAGHPLGEWPRSGAEDLAAAAGGLRPPGLGQAALSAILERALQDLADAAGDGSALAAGLDAVEAHLGLPPGSLAPAPPAFGLGVGGPAGPRANLSPGTDRAVLQAHWTHGVRGLVAPLFGELLDGRAVLLLADPDLPMAAEVLAEALLAAGLPPHALAVVFGVTVEGLAGFVDEGHADGLGRWVGRLGHDRRGELEPFARDVPGLGRLLAALPGPSVATWDLERRARDLGLDPGQDLERLADELVGACFEPARGYHGLVFDDEDRIVGWDARSAIVAASSDGESDVFVPGMQSVEQMVRDDEGNIYFVHSWEGAVYKIYPSGGTELVANGFDYSYPYGLFWGPDGHLYVVDGRVVRLNIETLEVTEILVPPGSGAWMAHAANFSLDSTALFVATVGNGDVLRVPLDENLDPAGEYEVFSNTPGGWQDSVGVDACGNLYIPEYYTGSLFRISPDGESKRVLEGRERDYGHGVVWGTGDGGWRRDAIYMPKPYDNTSVKEVVVGVPDGSLVRTWNGERVER